MHSVAYSRTHTAIDPARVARFERANYQAYYNRNWLALLQASVALVREAFGLGLLDGIRGAYLVARAEMAFAPVRDNNLSRAVAYMRRFYSMLNSRLGTTIDVDRAARLDVRWWQVHREHFADPDTGPLARALAEWMGVVYGLEPDDLITSARWRAAGMLCSDRWVRAGMPEPSTLLDEEERALMLSYQTLLSIIEDRSGARSYRRKPLSGDLLTDRPT